MTFLTLSSLFKKNTYWINNLQTFCHQKFDDLIQIRLQFILNTLFASSHDFFYPFLSLFSHDSDYKNSWKSSRVVSQVTMPKFHPTIVIFPSRLCYFYFPSLSPRRREQKLIYCYNFKEIKRGCKNVRWHGYSWIKCVSLTVQQRHVRKYLQVSPSPRWCTMLFTSFVLLFTSMKV